MQRKTEVDIPMEVMGLVIGKKHSNLRRIEKETGTKIEVENNKIYVSGGPQDTKNAIKELKNSAYYGIYKKRIKSKFSCDTYNFVDGSGRKCEFRLVPVECPRQEWHQDKEYFKIERVDEEDQMASVKEMGDLKGFISEVLQKIPQAIDGRSVADMPKADFWCHFGHLYITGNVDEDDQGKMYSLEDFHSQLNYENGWNMWFDSAIKDMKVKELEEALADSKYEKIPPHIRYDLSFITPSCTRIRAKFFLDLDGKPNLNFMDQLVDIKGDALSPTQKYVFCYQFVPRAKVGIAIPAYDMDVRITIRTVLSTLDMEETEHEETVKKYLDKVTFNTEGEILLPDENDMPDGFFLQYIRKCNRRSYSYTCGEYEDSFSILVSEEEEIDDLHDREIKTDIHLHSEHCDQLLSSGNWEPEQIIRKLPSFLLALKDVQDNIRN